MVQFRILAQVSKRFGCSSFELCWSSCIADNNSVSWVAFVVIHLWPRMLTECLCVRSIVDAGMCLICTDSSHLFFVRCMNEYGEQIQASQTRKQQWCYGLPLREFCEINAVWPARLAVKVSVAFKNGTGNSIANQAESEHSDR